ncbi:MAG: hypothetical protein ACJ72P_12595 [Nocardioides sp.]|jgi:hypothetical protein
MRPLQSIAMGLVIVALRAPLIGNYDALPDPLGWVLVILGCRGLPADLPRRDTVVTLAWLAALVSVPLWFPGVSAAAFAIHPSLAWALTLPQLGFAAVLCHSLATSAAEAEDHKSASWLRLAMAGFVVAAVLPVMVFGGGVGSLELTADVGAAVVLLALIWLLFSYSARPWAIEQPIDGPVD